MANSEAGKQESNEVREMIAAAARGDLQMAIYSTREEGYRDLGLLED